MPIEVTCSQCSKKLRVKDEVAGKKVKCPKCQSVIEVPNPSAEMWHIKTEDGETYGPVSRSELDEWVQEERITADCQVLLDGADQWQWASDVYPQLEEDAGPPTPAAPTPQAPTPTPQPTQQAPTPQPTQQAPTPQPTPQTPTPQPTQQAPTPQPTQQTPTPTPQPTESPAPAGAGEVVPGMFDFGVADSPTARLKGKRRVKKRAPGAAPAGGAGPSVAPGGAPNVTPAGGVATVSSKASAASGEVSDKSKLTAGLLAIFLGLWGVHRFYLGDSKGGIIRIVVTLCTCGFGGIWALIDTIKIFQGKEVDDQGRRLAD